MQSYPYCEGVLAAALGLNIHAHMYDKNCRTNKSEGILSVCRLTSPMLLIVIGLCGGAIYHVGKKNQPRRIMGK